MSVQRLIKVVPLGNAGLDYIKAHLAGVNTLCTALLDLVEAAPGEVFTLAPVEATRERMLRFSDGGLLGEGTLIAEQAKWLHGLLLSPEDVCIIDDFDPSFTEIRDAIDASFGYEDEAYRLFTRTDGEAAIAEALTQTNTIWHSVACVSAYAPDLDVDRVIAFDDLRETAHAAHAITCTAYDGEGFVAWRRM